MKSERDFLFQLKMGQGCGIEAFTKNFMLTANTFLKSFKGVCVQKESQRDEM